MTDVVDRTAGFPLASLGEWLVDGVHLARVRLGNQHDAEDAVQEACGDAVRAAGSFRGDLDQARGWFLTLVINRCRMVHRSGSRRAARATAVAATSGNAVADHPDPDLGEALGAALAKLPEHERLAIELRFLAGLDFAAIAIALERPEKTVRSQVDRGLARLRSVLPRVGLTDGGPAALGMVLVGLPRPVPTAALQAAVRDLPATPAAALGGQVPATWGTAWACAGGVVLLVALRP